MTTCVHGYPNEDDACKATWAGEDHVPYVRFPAPIKTIPGAPEWGDDDEEPRLLYSQVYVEGLETRVRHLTSEMGRWRTEAGILEEIIHGLEDRLDSQNTVR